MKWVKGWPDIEDTFEKENKDIYLIHDTVEPPYYFVCNANKIELFQSFESLDGRYQVIRSEDDENSISYFYVSEPPKDDE